jgi:hypothetical protein
MKTNHPVMLSVLVKRLRNEGYSDKDIAAALNINHDDLVKHADAEHAPRSLPSLSEIRWHHQRAVSRIPRQTPHEEHLHAAMQRLHNRYGFR